MNNRISALLGCCSYLGVGVIQHADDLHRGNLAADLRKLNNVREENGHRVKVLKVKHTQFD